MKRTGSLFVAATLTLLAACEPDTSRIVGQIESERIEITAEFAERIIEHGVAEGEPVSAGQLLTRQNSERIDARVAEAAAELQRRRERLAELVRGPRQERIEAAQAELEAARRDLQLRRIEYDRAEKLLEQDLASPQLRDRTAAALDISHANLEASEAQLDELLTGTTIEQLAQAEQSVHAAEARLELLEIDRARHETVAPVDGVVDSILFEPGERPQVGQAFMILLAGEQPYARVYIPEPIRVAVKPGDSARIFVDGLEQPLDGRVRWVASESAFTPYFALTQHDRGRLTYFAKIDLPNTDDRLPDGVPVEVEFPHISGMQQ